MPAKPHPAALRPPRWTQLHRMLLRQRWWLLGGLCAGWAAVVSLLWLLPPEYSSQALLLVEGQAVPQNYVQPNVEFNPAALLQTLGEQVLSRDRLAQIIEQYHLYPAVMRSQGEDAAVQRMRLDITLEPVSLDNQPTAAQGPWSALRLAFRASAPETAQTVAQRLTDAFIQENVRATQTASSRTTDFLREQLQQAGQQVEQAQQQLRQYESSHLGLLPGQDQANLAIVMNLQTELGASQAGLEQNQQEMAADQALLAQAPSSQEVNLRSQIAALRAQLADLRSRYTERYPAVAQAEQQLASLQTTLSQAEHGAAPAPAGAKGTADSPELAQARSRLQAAQAQLPRQQAAVARLQKQLEQYEHRLDLAPLPAAQLSGLDTAVQQAQANYQARLAKLANSEMASQLEQEQGGAQFQLVNAPAVPRQPEWPKPGLLAPLGLAAGVVLGLGVCLLRELARDCIAGEAELLELGLAPVWMHLPPLRSAGQRMRRGMRIGLEWITASGVLGALLAANLWIVRHGR